MRPGRRFCGISILALPLLLAACGGDVPPPVQSFPALNYSYLTPLHLNVVGLDVVDHSAPSGPDDVAARSPVTPQQALTEMAHDRLFPGGAAGQAEFVIDNAVIDRGPGETLDGSMSVHLDVTGPDGRKVGYAEAHVSRHHAPAGDEDRAAALYELTKQMTADMNVEFEYQVRQSLGAFLQSDNVVPAPVQAQPLSGGAPLPPVTAPGASDGGAPAGPQMSPPPGYLRPPGYLGPAPAASSEPAIPSVPPDPAAVAPVYQPPATPTPNPDGPIPLAPPS